MARGEERTGPFVDPRRGDLEDDLSSTKQHSMFSLLGGLLAEISLVKLVGAWIILLVLPGLALGVAPIVASAWVTAVAEKIFTPASGVVPLLILALFLAVGLFGARALLRFAESSFWSLAAVVVQPVYGACRETLRHFTERFVPRTTSARQLALLRATTAAVSGVIICAAALSVMAAVWPMTDLFNGLREIGSLGQLARVALANSVILVAAYLAAGALLWAILDTTMAQPADLAGFAAPSPAARQWRVVHLSDIHIVGERFGFRIESGRAGPSGNERLKQLFERLKDIDAERRLDIILISGDVTDAGRSAEWAEFFAVLDAHPELAGRVLIIPGNHDLNIVDRANPARMDLPTSPNRRLRQVRMLSAMAAVQGSRVHVVDREKDSISTTLSEALEPHRQTLERFADRGRPRFSRVFSEIWNAAFPMVLPPEGEDGLGIILLNSNADTHFSFTNALGMISAEQVQAIDIMRKHYPRACWIVALHHHALEYPRASKALSERIGTALINGNWFIRRMKPLAGHAVLMHGHRHIDWIGECEDLTIVSAPSPVMEATDDLATYFYIHTLSIDSSGRLRLLEPEKIELSGQTAS